MTDFLKHMPNEAAALHRIAKDMVDADADAEAVCNELMKEGIDRHYAEVILDNVLSDIQDRKVFIKLLIMGIFITVGGTALNLLSYFSASATGGFYIVFWGVVVTGIGILLKAISMYRNRAVY